MKFPSTTEGENEKAANTAVHYILSRIHIRYLSGNQKENGKNELKVFFLKLSKSTFKYNRKAVQTITAVFMLLLMFAVITGVLAAYYNYNISLQKQVEVEKARAQEQIAITKIGIKNGVEITNITIANPGQIEVKIRAIYRENNEATTFLADPSTYIPSGNVTTIDLTSLGLSVDPDAVFVAATENGVKSKGVSERLYAYDQTPSGVDTSGLSIGPLMLTFDSLNWVRVDSQGIPQGAWQKTWTIPTGACSWRLTLTNIDSENRSLTITQYSGFTTSLVSSPVTTTWYLKATQHTVIWNTTQTIEFLWDDSRSGPVSAGSNSRGVNNVFLTLFGSFSDGKTYAQTIPFEAITIV